MKCDDCGRFFSVIPAYAGVDLRRSLCGSSSNGDPRVRGGRPVLCVVLIIVAA